MYNNSIYIFAEERDVTVNSILDYLENNNVLRLNKSNTTIDIINEITSKPFSFWYKGSFVSLQTPFSRDNILFYEWKTIQHFIHSRLEGFASVSLGSFSKESYNNKLINLVKAKDIGLDVPNFIVTSEYSKVWSFVKKFKKIVLKPAWNMLFFEKNKIGYNTKNTVLNEIDIQNIPYQESIIFPSFIQEYIPKSYEIRSFYLKGVFYSMAIFSQKNEKTKLDYRNYDRESPNRNVPVKLPKEIEEKLHQFMIASDLDTGSIDIVVTKDGRYVFLEVNPVGQFGWLSVNCNYYLEEKIANYLAHGQTS